MHILGYQMEDNYVAHTFDILRLSKCGSKSSLNIQNLLGKTRNAEKAI